MAQYDGILLRQNLQDQGVMPRTGGWTTSPDLIAAGASPIQDPVKVFATEASYKADPTKPVVKNASNYIYLRGKNLLTDQITGEARVFWAKQSLFLYPSQWIENVIKTTKGEEFSKMDPLAAGAIGVTTDPLVWIPSDTSEHHCLVGFISTPDHPFASQKPPGGVKSLNELAAWIGKNGGTGWHNVQFTDAGAPTFTSSSNYPGSSKPAKVQFAITCIECPIGSEVSFSCGTPLPGGVYINLPKTKITKETQIGFVLEYEVPAGWTSPISYSYYANGKPPVGNKFQVAMSASIKETVPDQELFSEYARPAAEVFPNHRSVHPTTFALADMPVDKLVPVGSDATNLKL